VRFVLLPEEQHNLQRSPHMLLDTIRLKLQQAGGTEDSAYKDALFRWPDPARDAERWGEAEAALERALDDALPGGKGLVIVAIENFDTLLATLFKDDLAEQRLRGWLDRQKNRVMLLATATGGVDMDYDRPLFKAFQDIRLSPWTVRECLDYYNRLRARNGKQPLAGDEEAKARAITDFIGGTPRLAQLLAEVLETRDALRTCRRSAVGCSMR
jgi:hypothetical protein